MALVAPIPAASVSTTTAVKPGRLRQRAQRVAQVVEHIDYMALTRCGCGPTRY
jgi:hypothetical protein